VGEQRIAAVSAELHERGLLADDALTPTGVAFADQLVSARRDVLCERLADPTAERAPEVQELLERLSRELVGERP
jgi:hypothetical protein